MRMVSVVLFLLAANGPAEEDAEKVLMSRRSFLERLNKLFATRVLKNAVQ